MAFSLAACSHDLLRVERSFLDSYVWLEWAIGAVPHSTSPEVPVDKGKQTLFEQVEEAHLQVAVGSNVLEWELS